MILKDKKYMVLFLTPALLLVTAFLYFPLILNVIMGFFDIGTGVTLKGAKYIGLANFKALIDDPVIGKALINTLIVMVGCIIFEIGLAMFLAFLVDTITKGLKFFRTVFFFPTMISGTAIGLMFYLIYDYEYGLLNFIFNNIFGAEKVLWLQNETASIYLCLIPIVWQMVGFYFVIVLTAMTTVPADIYESAMLDGITGVKKAFYITIPLIWDVIVSSIIFVVAGTFRVFDVAFMITNGGPLDSSQLLSTYMNSHRGTNNDYAAAIATLIIICGVVVNKIANILTKRESVSY
ncbi:MAG: sugar ABC transporter permease [Clostridia bacterium]|nr:sugar ABC transporter permease [Clostridia bacterium]